jgi:sugar (pentulose or hexulose) kinase
MLLVILLCLLLPASQSSKYVIGADAGTESIRVGLFSASGQLIKCSAATYPTTFPHPSWAEQQPQDWWEAFGKACNEVMNSQEISGTVTHYSTT